MYGSTPPLPRESNPIYMDTEGSIESVHIKWVEFRENVTAFFPQGQTELSVIMRCLYLAGVCKAGSNLAVLNLIQTSKISITLL